MYFIIGSIVASFFAVMLKRLPRNENFISGRSHCDHCHHILAWYEMIPVISYIVLRGRCSSCHKRIDPLLWYTEILGGILLTVLGYYYDIKVAVYLYAVIMILFVIAVIDLKTMIIPDSLLVCLLVLSFISLYYHKISIHDIVMSVLVSFSMILMNLIVKDSFGFGDIKLMAVSGILLGYKRNILAFVLAILLASIYSVFLVCTKKATKNDFIAFGPFLCSGILICLFKGYEILSLCM